MLTKLKDILMGTATEDAEEGSSLNSRKKLQAATYALFIELANSDDEFTENEKKLIYNIIKKQFDLDSDEMSELHELAETIMNRSVSLYEYTDIINRHFSSDEKYEVLKNLWRLILIDGKLDAHEEYFIRTISRNLHMEHSDLIAAKMEIKEEMDF